MSQWFGNPGRKPGKSSDKGSDRSLDFTLGRSGRSDQPSRNSEPDYSDFDGDDDLDDFSQGSTQAQAWPGWPTSDRITGRLLPPPIRRKILAGLSLPTKKSRQQPGSNLGGASLP